MLQDVIHPPPLAAPPQDHQLPIEEMSSPISAQMFEFCENEFFPDTLPTSEVSSCSNYCYEDNSSYTTNISFSSPFPSDIGRFNSNSNNNSISSITSNTPTNPNTPTTNHNNISILYDPQDDSENTDITASMSFLPNPNFSMPPNITTQEDQFDISTLQPQMQMPDVVNGLSAYPSDLVGPMTGVPLSLGFQDDCLSTLPSYGNLDPSSPCSLMDPTMGQFMPGNLSTALSADGSGIYPGGILMGNELEFQGENIGVYGSDSVQQCYSSGDIQQSLSSENQQLVNGVGSSTLTSEISNLEESAYKIGRLSVEERKERIHRYMKKRNERNFSKKIKYACRKTLADSRPRVRGRFAKNDDFGEPTRTNSGHHEDEDDEEVTIKEEEEMVDSSDIFAHISGVNSFKCNYPSLQSWI
ncbi:hypothetical protein ACHQM5_014236 [Ranunculus cassubicifolius]